MSLAVKSLYAKYTYLEFPIHGKKLFSQSIFGLYIPITLYAFMLVFKLTSYKMKVFSLYFGNTLTEERHRFEIVCSIDFHKLLMNRSIEVIICGHHGCWFSIL